MMNTSYVNRTGSKMVGSNFKNISTTKTIKHVPMDGDPRVPHEVFVPTAQFDVNPYNYPLESLLAATDQADVARTTLPAREGRGSVGRYAGTLDTAKSYSALWKPDGAKARKFHQGSKSFHNFAAMELESGHPKFRLTD